MVALFVGGGVLWRLEPLLRRYYAPPGPILALSSANMQGKGNHVWPRVLQVENIGDKPAFEITWEIRDYYHPCVPPCFTRSSDSRALPLKPQEPFRLDVITEHGESEEPGHTGSLSLAHFSHYEIMIWYRGPNRAKYLSHFSLHHGTVTRHQPGMTPVRRAVAFLRVRIWLAQLWVGICIQTTVKTRPYLYKLRNWIIKRPG